MKIVIASDHAGFELKTHILEFLKTRNIAYFDAGTNNFSTSVDYPDFAEKASRMVSEGVADLGILICGTGIGMSITANKIRGIRAASVSDTYSARMSRIHNNANVLCIGSRVIGVGLALDIVDAWLSANFEGGRHKKRVDKIVDIEGGKR